MHSSVYRISYIPSCVHVHWWYDLFSILQIRYWADLNEDERQAATVLGYTAETWDKEGMLAKCCVIQ